MGHMLEFPINVSSFYAGIPYQNVLWFSSSGFNSAGFHSKRFLRLSAATMAGVEGVIPNVQPCLRTEQ